MEFLQLLYFCDAAQTQSFSETAKKFNVPPASISQSVKRLETELGVSLFDRNANSIELNERGRAFYLQAKSGLDMLSEAKNKVTDNEVEGKINLLVITHAATVNKAVCTFYKQYPKVNFTIDHTKRWHYDNYDLIITDNFPFKESYKRCYFMQEPIVAVIHKSHPLAKKDIIAPLDLKGERLMTLSQGSGTETLVTRICADAGFTHDLFLQTDDEYSMLNFVEEGLGIALLPKRILGSLFSESIVTVPISDITTRSTVLCYNKNKYQTKAVRLFLETLIATAKEEEEKG